MKLSTLIASASATVLVLTAAVSAAVTNQEGMTQTTKQHEWLRTHVGTWDGKISGMMGESTAAWTIEEGPGGLWLVSDFRANLGGMPFQGKEFMGFDPETEMFHQVWIDSFSNKPMTLTGTYDEASSTLTMKGISTTPAPDGSAVEMTHTLRFTDADHIAFTMASPGPDGTSVTAMSIEYTRRK